MSLASAVCFTCAIPQRHDDKRNKVPLVLRYLSPPAFYRAYLGNRDQFLDGEEQLVLTIGSLHRSDE